MSTYYTEEKQVNDTLLKGMTFYLNTGGELPGSNDEYRIYYLDSEWKELGDSEDSINTATFTQLGDFFDDGRIWIMKFRGHSLGVQSTPQVKFIVVRLSDRKAGLVSIRGTSGFPAQQLSNAGEKTVTDVSENVWYDELRKLSLLGYI